MRPLGRCGVLYRPQSLGLHRILYRTLHANRQLRPTPSCSIEAPGILYRNGNTAVTVTTAYQRHFSASGWHNAKRVKLTSRLPSRYKWVTRAVPDEVHEEVYAVLESHILDSSRRASERFPVAPETLDSDDQIGTPHTYDPHNPENETPPYLDFDLDLDPDLDPDPDDPRFRRKYDAVVIDCEMVAMKGREQGLINIAAVDLFTGNVLLRSLVRPAGPVTDWRREITGFNKSMLMEAVKKGKVYSGWEKVREKIFEKTTSETIFIGHALANDLRVLRIATDRVIDTMLIMSRAVYGDAEKPPRHWGLKAACHELLDLAVQKTRGPHNPLEDAYATRELLLRCVLSPDKLAQWAASTRANMAQIVEKERAKQEAKIEKKKRRIAERESKTPEQRALEVAEKARRREERQTAKEAEKARAKAEKQESKAWKQKVRAARLEEKARQKQRKLARKEKEQQEFGMLRK